MKTSLRRVTACAIKIAVPLMLLAAAVFAFLPLMSAYCGGGESFTLVVRAINLREFSAWGTAALMFPLAAAAVHYAKLDGKTKVLATVGTFTLNSVAYAEAVRQAYEWLGQRADGMIWTHRTSMLYPIALAVLYAAMYFGARMKNERGQI